MSNGTGCPSIDVSPVIYTVDCSGKKAAYAPLWTIDASLQQTFPLSNGANVVGEAHAHFQSDSFAGANFLPAEVQPSYATADFALTYAAARDRWFLTAYVNNAFDKTVISNTNIVPFSTPYLVVGLRPPRTYGVRVGAHFE